VTAETRISASPGRRPARPPSPDGRSRAVRQEHAPLSRSCGAPRPGPGRQGVDEGSNPPSSTVESWCSVSPTRWSVTRSGENCRSGSVRCGPGPTWERRSRPARTGVSPSRRRRGASEGSSTPSTCFQLDFSSWHWTTSPVGTCVMRTAESVVLTLWPPARTSGTRRSGGRPAGSGRQPLPPRASPPRSPWRYGSAPRLRRRHALDPVNAAFVLQAAVRPRALDHGDHFLVPPAPSRWERISTFSAWNRRTSRRRGRAPRRRRTLRPPRRRRGSRSGYSFRRWDPSGRARHDLLRKTILFQGQPFDLLGTMTFIAGSFSAVCSARLSASSCFDLSGTGVAAAPAAARRVPADPCISRGFPVTDGPTAAVPARYPRRRRFELIPQGRPPTSGAPDTCRNDAIATSICARPAPGGKPLQPQPGATSTRNQGTGSFSPTAAAPRRRFQRSPGSAGSRRSAFVSRELSLGMKEKTRILITITNRRKLVPHRGCSGGIPAPPPA